MDQSKYHTALESPGEWDTAVLARIYGQVFRTDFEAPGVALVSFARPIASRALRASMLQLKRALNDLHRKATGKSLVYLSMGRFDSQVTTKFHLDGAPDEAFLMLGYEATPVHSALSVADYSRAARDWKMEPRQLLSECNPMFADNEKKLLPYISKLEVFDPAQSQILLLNNSSQPFTVGSQNFLGVMHQATITPDPGAQRIIDSTMISTAADPADEPMTAEAQRVFAETAEITGSL